MNTPHYSIYHADFCIRIPPEAQSTIRIRPLYHRLMNLLRSRGFEVGFDPFNGAKGYQPRRWNWQTSLGHCRDLHFTAELNENCSQGVHQPNHCAGYISLKFWQNIVLEKGRQDGRHAGSRFHLMPYLIRLHYQLTVQHLIDFLHRTYPGTFSQDTTNHWPEGKPQIGRAYLMHRMASWKWHTPKEGYDPFTWKPTYNYVDSNSIDATGQPIIPGQLYKAYTGFDGKQLVQGFPIYAFNGSWLIYSNESSGLLHTHHTHIYPLRHPLPRRRLLPLRDQLRKASSRLEKLAKSQEFEKAISTRDFIRRHTPAAASK